MKNYLIASFYKFVPLTNFEDMKFPLLAEMNKYQLLGTLILASEGINGSFAGKEEDVHQLYAYLRQDPRFTDLSFRERWHDIMPFEKAKVKFRKEIVTMGVSDISPLQKTGIRVAPLEWNALISDPNVMLIDTRNHYEVEIGTFKGAIDPNTENFRDFPKYVEEHLMDKKDKKIAMCCTGGVRCEKSTAYLLELGFKEVYQLDGGILNYLDSVTPEQSLWQGECFVFDERISVDR